MPAAYRPLGTDARRPGNAYVMRPVRTTARVLLSGTFLAGGARALANPDRLVPQAKRITDKLAPLLTAAGPAWTLDARRLVQLNGAVQLGAGLLLAAGYLRRPAAALLAASLIPTTIAGHPFWTYHEPAERHRQQLHFLKNLGLFGGLLLAASDTQGQPSLRWRARRFAGDQRRSISRVGRKIR
jgi:putative oxidoreductase